ncbi:MAG: YciI family protein [Reinekea sp.]|jgi:hypothetical protein|nr:YciI family protein [Reinekea sp.]
MKVMVLVHPGNPTDYEQGAMPEPELLAAMGKFNEALVEAGVMIGGEGLKPTTHGARIAFSAKGEKQFSEGPFTEITEIVGGFWMWHVNSMAEAIEWANRAPMENGATLELRPVFEPEDFGPDVAEKERALMDKLEQQQR